MANTENIIKQLVNENIPFFLMVNKVDRLILELKLPPEDAYFKLKHTIEEVNSILFKISDIRLSPEKGNVLFGSTEMGWCFSLKSFAAKYCVNSEGSYYLIQNLLMLMLLLEDCGEIFSLIAKKDLSEKLREKENQDCAHLITLF